MITYSDIPAAQFILSWNNSLPTVNKFIVEMLDDTHIFVRPDAGDEIENVLKAFRDQNSSDFKIPHR